MLALISLRHLRLTCTMRYKYLTCLQGRGSLLLLPCGAERSPDHAVQFQSRAFEALFSPPPLILVPLAPIGRRPSNKCPSLRSFAAPNQPRFSIWSISEYRCAHAVTIYFSNRYSNVRYVTLDSFLTVPLTSSIPVLPVPSSTSSKMSRRQA